LVIDGRLLRLAGGRFALGVAFHFVGHLACVLALLALDRDHDGQVVKFDRVAGLHHTDGPCKGRKVWDRLCISHPNELTQKIARGNLSAICRAVDVMQPRDSVELHNLPLVVTVKCKKREDTGDVTNEVKGYAKRESAAGQPQQAPANDQTPPWAR